MGARVWSDVQVAIQSALAAAVTITGITNANPAVVSHAGTDPANGDYVVMKVQGMTEINERVFRVANAAAGSFELEGEDSTNYGTFASGTFEVITFGTTLGIVRSVSASGGDYNYIDTTTIHDKISTQVPGVASPLEYSLENRWQPEDAGFKALQAASAVKAQRAVRLKFADGAISVFYGYVGFSGVPGGSAQDLVTSPGTVTASGLPTNYAV